VYETDLSEDQIARLDGAASAERPPESPARRAEVHDILDQLLEELPERDRELLVLKEVEGFSVQELAEILDVNVNTVKVRLFRTRARLMDVYRHRLAADPNFRAAKGRVKIDGTGN
jgi:RNA polymerase sigma-70 factor (ECF subfamily)